MTRPFARVEALEVELAAERAKLALAEQQLAAERLDCAGDTARRDAVLLIAKMLAAIVILATLAIVRMRS